MTIKRIIDAPARPSLEHALGETYRCLYRLADFKTAAGRAPGDPISAEPAP
jgi:hypothetical protein